MHMLWFDWFLICYASLLGLVVGSFLNVCVYRVPLGLSVAAGRSFCPACKHTLAGRDLVPVFSWIVLKRKCRYCKAPISSRYPAVELGNGALWMLITLRFGLQWHTLLLLAFESALLVAALIALDGHALPNALIWWLAPLCILEAFLQPALLPVTERLLGLFCLIVPLFALSRAKCALPAGAAVLCAACGAFLGWRLTLLGALFALLGAALVHAFFLLAPKNRCKANAFIVPYLAFGFTVSALWGNALLQSCLHLFIAE